MMPEDHIDSIILAVMEDAAGEIVDDIQGTLAALYPPASSPGEYPHKRTGELQGSITSELVQSGPITVLVITSNAPHSVFLEFGTDRMAARPFMFPARDQWAPVIHQSFTSAFSIGRLNAAA